MEPKEAFAWLVAIVLFGGGFWLWSEWPRISGIRKCDAAIQEKLVTPSTYRRVDYSYYSGGSFTVDYDAENSFGALQRGKAYCDVEGGLASVTIGPHRRTPEVCCKTPESTIRRGVKLTH